MSVQLVVDMNLSVEWITELGHNGWTAVHWSAIGDPRAEDTVIMEWARRTGMSCLLTTLILAPLSH